MPSNALFLYTWDTASEIPKRKNVGVSEKV